MNLTIVKRIAAPVEHVFDVFTAFERAADNVSGIKSLQVLTDGPVGVGTRFRETRTMFGRDSTEEMEITRFEAGRCYAVEAESCGAHFRTLFTFTPGGSVTEVRCDLSTRPLTLFARVMSPLGVLFAGTMKKCFESDLDDLKRVCEGGVATAG